MPRPSAADQRLWAGVINNKPDEVTRAIAEGADVNCHNSNRGEIPLQTAIAHANPQIIHTLMTARGFNKDAYNGKRQTALHTAVSRNDLGTFQMLLDRGANTNFQDEDGKTPLHLAAEQHDGLFVGKLLRAGADPTIRDNRDETPRDEISMEAYNLLEQAEQEHAAAQAQEHGPATARVIGGRTRTHRTRGK